MDISVYVRQWIYCACYLLSKTFPYIYKVVVKTICNLFFSILIFNFCLLNWKMVIKICFHLVVEMGICQLYIHIFIYASTSLFLQAFLKK